LSAAIDSSAFIAARLLLLQGKKMHNYAFERSARQLRCRVPSSLALLGARSTPRYTAKDRV
jgi:hypothetical protein